MCTAGSQKRLNGTGGGFFSRTRSSLGDRWKTGVATSTEKRYSCNSSADRINERFFMHRLIMWQIGKIISGVAYWRVIASVRGSCGETFFLLISAAKTVMLNVTCLLEQAVVLPSFR
jgi:hypothetical protein